MSYDPRQGVRHWVDRSRRIGTLAAGSLLLALLALPGVARAIDPALCKDDGVTEVPPFAERRDANGCLVVDPKNGDAPILFQYETFHGYGVTDVNNDYECRSSLQRMDNWNASDYGKCRSFDPGNPAKSCTYLVWDTVADNYLDYCTRNQDIHKGSFAGRENTLWYQVSLYNGWKCKTGGDWKGPNGLYCDPADTTVAHTDGLQINGPANNGGWFAMIDSRIVNAGISLIRIGSVPAGSQIGAQGNLLVQGFEAAMKQRAGVATNYVDDCYARGVDTCESNRVDMAMDWDEAWLIDVYGNVRFDGFHGSTNKVVVINTGCDESGCNGAIGYKNGWPHPLKGAVQGPGVCPNGLITQSAAASDGSVGATFCYTSIEKALADTATSTANQGDCPAAYCPHQRPPFIHLSAAGWEVPPTTSRPRPASPSLEP